MWIPGHGDGDSEMIVITIPEGNGGNGVRGETVSGETVSGTVSAVRGKRGNGGNGT